MLVTPFLAAVAVNAINYSSPASSARVMKTDVVWRILYQHRQHRHDVIPASFMLFRCCRPSPASCHHYALTLDAISSTRRLVQSS